MKYERFGWYDLKLWIRKLWKLCLILAAFLLVAVIVCTQPLTTDYHRMFWGYELHFESEAAFVYHNASETESKIVILDGKITRYLFKPDVFEGELFISGFEQVQDEWAVDYLERWPDTNCSIRIESDGEVTQQILNSSLSGDFTRGENEKIMRVWACLDRGKEFFCFEIVEPNVPMEFGDYDCIIAPASYPERADRKFRELVLDDILDFWESVSVWEIVEPEE